MNVAVGFRGYGTSTRTYGSFQSLNRKSILFEATKYLFDYHGFVPFVGPVVSYERLNFTEIFEGNASLDFSNTQFGYGLTFGWDIRPNRIQTWLLRTNLRWYPSLNLKVTQEFSVDFNTIEFNFIQMVIFPSRMF